jgi:hypothetical protein
MAERLGVNRKTLYRRLVRHGLSDLVSGVDAADDTEADGCDA